MFLVGRSFSGNSLLLSVTGKLADCKVSSTELESGNATGGFLQTQPQCWVKFLDPWVQDFYPTLGWGLATSYREHSSSQHPHWIKVGLPESNIQGINSYIAGQTSSSGQFAVPTSLAQQYQQPKYS